MHKFLNFIERPRRNSVKREKKNTFLHKVFRISGINSGITGRIYRRVSVAAAAFFIGFRISCLESYRLFLRRRRTEHRNDRNRIAALPNLRTCVYRNWPISTRAFCFRNCEVFFSINRAQCIAAETTVLRRQYISTSTFTFRIAGRKAGKK